MSFTIGTLPIVSGQDTSQKVPTSGIRAVLIGNESGLTCQITMEGGNVQKTLYPSMLDWFAIKQGFTGNIKIHPVTVLNNVAAWPSSSLIFDAIGVGDSEKASMYPVAIPRVSNTGNSQAVVSSNAIVDDGRVAGSNTIESTVGANIFSSGVITNDGKITIKDSGGNIVFSFDLATLTLTGNQTLGAVGKLLHALGSIQTDLNVDINGVIHFLDNAANKRTFATNDGTTNDHTIYTNANHGILHIKNAAQTNDIITFADTSLITTLFGQLKFIAGSITRISSFDASVTTTSSNFAHGLGAVPDLVLGINDGTSSTANPLKWNKAGSDATNAALVSTANGTFHCIAIKF